MQNVTIELEIERLAGSGDGVGRGPDGRVVFVPLSAPGDRVRVALVEQHERFRRGRIEALLRPGPERSEPRCAVFGECGGCSWQHLSYPAQLAAKRAILADALRRIGRIELPELPEVEPSPQAYGYRGRSRVIARGGRVGFRRRASHELCAVEACPVLEPELESALQQLARSRPADGEWELARGARGAHSVRLPIPSAARAVPGAPERRSEWRIAGEVLRTSPGVFTQSNPALCEALVRAVHEACGRGSLVLDAFCGAGLFSLGLARRFERVIALESNAAAIADLRANLAAAGLANVEVVEQRFEHWLEAGAGAANAIEVAVVDPPRAGLPDASASRLAERVGRRLIYVSCDPATLARDLARILACGFELVSLRGFDLFPQTPHIEAVAVLERAAGRAGRGPSGAGAQGSTMPLRTA